MTFNIPYPVKVFGYLYFSVDHSHISGIPPFMQIMLDYLDSKPQPYFFIIDSNKFNVDLDNVHPVSAADLLVGSGLLINTNISYN